jgi:hypothetical protein
MLSPADVMSRQRKSDMNVLLSDRSRQFHLHGFFACACALVSFIWTSAVAAVEETGVAEIELRRLLEPTKSEIAQEQKGRIYIYEGLRDIDVERAMDREFNRIEHMMFIRTRKTNDKGDVVRDPNTGEAEVEDDGC